MLLIFVAAAISKFPVHLLAYSLGHFRSTLFSTLEIAYCTVVASVVLSIAHYFKNPDRVIIIATAISTAIGSIGVVSDFVKFGAAAMLPGWVNSVLDILTNLAFIPIAYAI